MAPTIAALKAGALLKVLSLVSLSTAVVALASVPTPERRLPDSSTVRWVAPQAAKPGTFRMRATARRLWPGAKRPLKVKVTNPFGHKIKVTRIVAWARNDPRRPTCTAGKFVRFSKLTAAKTFPARRTRQLVLKARMLKKAPDACKGVVFPLRLKGTAAKV